MTIIHLQTIVIDCDINTPIYNYLVKVKTAKRIYIKLVLIFKKLRWCNITLQEKGFPLKNEEHLKYEKYMKNKASNFLLLLSVIVNAKKIKQLQISVRYRPRECTRKSKKGVININNNNHRKSVVNNSNSIDSEYKNINNSDNENNYRY
ncbi:hypothetical protein H8356DRAFT_1350792 [Neocallimastix lanati (nom. inval.)]|nr:hypothetical protein H8356DRAFT_1350792 [Neocallimastix sp. JGI-2020a]